MPGVFGCCKSMLKIGRKADSVLPVAVGDISSMFFPSKILGMVFAWGSVGFRNPFCSMSLRTGFTSNSKAFSVASDNKETFEITNYALFVV